MKKMISLLSLCFLVAFGYAQDGTNIPEGSPLAKRVEAIKVAFITDKLQLTPEESQQFWPIYNEYEDKQKEIRQAYQFSDSFATMTDAQAEQMLNDHLEMERRLLDLKRDYIDRMRSAIPVRKIVMLNRVEAEFRKELVKRLRELQMNRRRRGGNDDDK